MATKKKTTTNRPPYIQTDLDTQAGIYRLANARGWKKKTAIKMILGHYLALEAAHVARSIPVEGVVS